MIDKTEAKRTNPAPGTCIATLITELLGAGDPAAIDAAASMLEIAIGVRGGAENLAIDTIARGRRTFTALLIRVLREIAAIRSSCSEEERDDLLASLRSSSNWPGCIPRERVIRLLQTIGARTTCEACGRTIWFAPTHHGKLAPFTGEGLNHFIDCPAAGRFRKAEPEKPEKGGQQP